MTRAKSFRPPNRWRSARQLLLILGDQLSRDHPDLAKLAPDKDVILMCEVREEAEHVPSHVQRTTLFLSAMRHHAQWLMERGYRVRYIALDDPGNTHTLSGELARAIADLGPQAVRCMQAGEHRVAREIGAACRKAKVTLHLSEDPSFTCTLAEFDDWASGRKSLTMEYFYRERRRALDILVDANGKPEGGSWNFDADNRETFTAPPEIPAALPRQTRRAHPGGHAAGRKNLATGVRQP